MTSLRGFLSLVVCDLKLAYRVRIAFFFAFIFPLLMFFLYAYVFGKGDPMAVAFMMGPLITLVIVGSGLYGVSNQLVALRELGAYRPFFLTPATAALLVLSRTFSSYLLLLPVVLVQFALARIIFRIPISTTPLVVLSVIVMITVASLAISALGTLAATLADSSAASQVINQILFILMIFLSGATIPLEGLSPWIQKLSLFVPSTYLVRMIQGTLSANPQAMKTAWQDASVLAASTALWLAIAVKLFRWDAAMRLSRRQCLLALATLLPLGLYGGLCLFVLGK